MNRILAVAGLCAAGLVGSAAQANAVTAGEAGVQAGRCIVRADRETAISLLKSLPLSGGAVNWSSLGLGYASKCSKAASRPVTVAALRGGLAQELFRRDFGAIGVEPTRGVGELARFDLPVEKNTMGAEDPTKTLFLVADCVARSNTDGAEQLVQSEPGSPQEMRAFEALQPWMSVCQKTGQMAYGRTELRSAIVQAAYHTAQRYAAGELTQAAAQ